MQYIYQGTSLNFVLLFLYIAALDPSTPDPSILYLSTLPTSESALHLSTSESTLDPSTSESTLDPSTSDSTLDPSTSESTLDPSIPPSPDQLIPLYVILLSVVVVIIIIFMVCAILKYRMST